MEVIDLGFDTLEPISLSSSGAGNDIGSTTMGLGAEFLMNDKKRTTQGSMKIDLGELDKLESELNELSSETNKKVTSSGGMAGISEFFGYGVKDGEKGKEKAEDAEPAHVTFKIEEELPSLGSQTAGVFGGFTKTMDGFAKINEVPRDDEASRMSERDRRRKKRLMLKKLDEWYEKGILRERSGFNMDSPYDEIEDEYEGAMEDKRRKDSIKMQQWWFITLVSSVEYANATFDPFDVNLDGWSEQVSEDIDSYEDIFSELYQKYKGGKLSPELSLMMRLGFSAAMVNFTNKALSTATPGFQDVMKQSPELMKSFSAATAQAMKQKSSGFNFMSEMMNQEPQVNTSYGPPPVPMQTKIAPPSQRPAPTQYTNRPDLATATASPMFQESGVRMNNPQENLVDQERSYVPRSDTSKEAPRPEMKGPQNVDIQQLLNGLKPAAEPAPSSILHEDTESMISAMSARAMSQSKPKRSYRRKTSEKNTISLDI